MEAGKNKRRLKNIFGWLAAGDFGQLRQAISDQFWLRTARPRRYARDHHLFGWRQKALLRRLLEQYYDMKPQANGKGLNVALVVRDGATIPRSSAFIRLISPLTHPSLKNQLSLRIYDENTTEFRRGTEVVIVQRTAFDHEATARQLVSKLRAAGVSLVVDNDDAFHAIDSSHPEYQAQVERVAALDYLITEADQVWLSVPKLAEDAGAANDKTVVVANCLDARLWRPEQARPATAKDAPISLVYMGTGTHGADLEMLLPALDKVANERPGSFTLTIIGVAEDTPSRPWIRRLEAPHTIQPLFVKWFIQQGPFDIGLAPLVDSEFNRAKSDIKCLDYLANGTVPVVSDVLPYQAPELQDFIVKVNNTPEAWAAKLIELVKDPEAFRAGSAKLMPRAQDYLWSKRSVAVASGQVFGLLQQLRK
jgi:O-antigen biosynthesis protein